MKKFYSFLFAAAALVGFAACSTDEGIENVAPEQEGVMEFVASFDETRTTLDGMDVKWCAGDEIDVNGSRFALTAGAGTTSATFTLKDGETPVTAPFIATYPASARISAYDVEGSHYVTCLLESNVGVGTFNDGANIALASSEDNTLAFKNTLAVLKFQVAASCEEITFATDNEVSLVGQYTAGTAYGELNAVANDAPSSFTLTGNFEAGNYYYTTVIPGRYGLTISIDGIEVATKANRIIEKNKIYNLGVLPEPLGEAHETFGIVGEHQGWDTANKEALYQIPNTNTYVRRNVTLTGGFKFYGETSKAVCEEGDLYLVPNSNWKKDDARFAAYFFGTSGDTWASMKDDNKDGIYVVNKPTTGTYEKVIFCRMDPANATNDWTFKWNQTGDLVIPTNGDNCFTLPSSSWNGATSSWGVHVPEAVVVNTIYWFGMNQSDNISDWVTGYSNNAGKSDITVADTSKKYDIYFSREADQDWGFVYYFAVREAGSAAPELK